MALTPTEEAETRQLLAQLTELLSLADNQPAIISELGADDITIPELDAVTSILTTDEFLLNQGGAVKRATGTNLFDFTQTYVRLTTYIATKDYVVGDRVVGSDGKIYNCRIANGPTTSVVNPVTDTALVWSLTEPHMAGKLVILPYEPTATQLAQERMIIANGASVLDSEYSGVLSGWNNIKLFGNVDSSHFNIPNFDAKTLRFFGATSGPDSASRADRGDGTTGNAVGTTEEDAFQAWQMGVTISGTTYYGYSEAANFNVDASSSVGFAPTRMNSANQGHANLITSKNDGTNGSPRTSSETRMENILVWGGIYF